MSIDRQPPASLLKTQIMQKAGTKMATHYVDSDGHVMERVDEIAKLIENQNGIECEIHVRRMVPSLDRFHTPRLQRRTPGTFDPAIGPERWKEFLDKTGLEYSVLYPTEGLAYGQVSFVDWAVAYARGYNDWRYEKYLKFSRTRQRVALIPVQDVPGAVVQLHHAGKGPGPHS